MTKGQQDASCNVRSGTARCWSIVEGGRIGKLQDVYVDVENNSRSSPR